MMNPFKRIKQDLYEERNRIGLRKKIMVDTRSLIELLDDYEVMDSYARSESDMHEQLEAKLENVLRALYAENHDSENLMLLIMAILKPMIEQRLKERAINKMYSL